MMEHSKKKHCEEGYKEPVVVTSSFEAHGQHGEANGESPAALPKCDPNSCGESPMVEHSKKKHCEEGYKEPVGATSNFEAHCQHDGTWLGVKTGGPISCGLPPTRDNTSSISGGPENGAVVRTIHLPCEANGEFPQPSRSATRTAAERAP